MAKNVKRLYEQFQPSNYQLSLNPDANALTFKGTVVITGKKVGRPSQRITLHQKDLKITSAKLTHHDKKGETEIPLTRVNTHKSYDEVRLHSGSLIYPGAYTITLEFCGTITKNMTGMYPCFFTHEGKEKRLIATQFESHHAREAFPCIDEPEAKATFDLTLTSPHGETVLSNTPIKQQKKAKQLTTTFETTPIMSSYLLAFVIGEIHCVEAKSKNGILMRSWGHVAQPKKFLQYANDEAVKVIDFFEDYFDTPFPLKKCDQIALPDFESGAMENWGLITYREIAMLADPDNRSISGEQYVSMVVAHELSHQWFGNLVTMKWWDDLWLNESFASLMEHVALDVLHPDWQQWEHYASADIIACSNRDIYKDVQSVRVEVRHPDEIQTLFDPAIVYAKGGRLLKMLIEHIGENDFRKGLKLYFDRHRYGNTSRDDLWAALSEVSGQDISAFMNPWLTQSGMPLLSVSEKGDRIELSQERFVLDSDNDASLWPIPLFADQPLDNPILDTRSGSVRSTDTTTVFNKNGSGHYLVRYSDPDQQKNLMQAIAGQKIPPEGRINSINDMLLMTRRGDVSIVEALQLVAQMSHEPRDAVWALMCRAIGLAGTIAEGEKSLEASMRIYKKSLAETTYKRLGWEDNASDDPNTQQLRNTAIALMVGAEDTAALDHAEQLFKKLPLDKLPSEQRGIVLSAVVRHRSSDKIIKDLIAEYTSSHNPDLQMAIASALTHTKDLEVAKQLFASGLRKDGYVRNQDVFRWYAYLMRNRYTRDLAWDWLTSNWHRLEEDFGQGKSMDHFIVYAAAPLHTRAWQKKFVDFFTPKSDIVALKRNIVVALSEIEARVTWHERDLPKLKKYFS